MYFKCRVLSEGNFIELRSKFTRISNQPSLRTTRVAQARMLVGNSGVTVSQLPTTRSRSRGQKRPPVRMKLLMEWLPTAFRDCKMEKKASRLMSLRLRLGTQQQRWIHLFERMEVTKACLVGREERMWISISSGKLLILSAAVEISGSDILFVHVVSARQHNSEWR